MRPGVYQPAFPLPEYNDTIRTDRSEGMTLRDYFAAQALAGFAAQYAISDAVALAEKCYRIADAMLDAREK